MNYPSRTDELPKHDGLNQNPSALAGNPIARQDFDGRDNKRTRRKYEENSKNLHILEKQETHEMKQFDGAGESSEHSPSRQPTEVASDTLPPSDGAIPNDGIGQRSFRPPSTRHQDELLSPGSDPASYGDDRRTRSQQSLHLLICKIARTLIKFGSFIGPGFIVAVAYIDPGNYSTDIAAGVATRFRLLFIVLMSNMFAIILQTLAIRLGTVTGLNLAQHCRAHLPKWMNLMLYLLGEGAIIATDIAEVIGSAIALNLLLKIPLVAGCAITIADVLLILILYRPGGSMRYLRWFELFVVALVIGVVICFCIELSLIHNQHTTSAGEVFRGFVPSSAIVDGQGLYLSCGILGATVMPHSLYLGSGMVQSRLQVFDARMGNNVPDGNSKAVYRPSLAAIKSCLSYSIADIIVSLSIFALFVNSAILIVAGASLSSNSSAGDADLFGIHDLLSKTLAPAAGTIFALALLLSGTSAGIVCTIAGQILSEGALNWSVAPWVRRLLTRSIAIVPSIIIAGTAGRNTLDKALNGTQVALSVALPFVSAPLIYFTCRNQYMFVNGTTMTTGSPEDMTEEENDEEGDEGREQRVEGVKMRNNWVLSTFAILIWLVITVMNIALLVLLALGKAGS